MQIKKNSEGHISETDLLVHPFKHVFEHINSVYYILPMIVLSFIITALGVVFNGDTIMNNISDDPEELINSLALVLGMLGLSFALLVLNAVITNYSKICIYIAATENYNKRKDNIKEVMGKAIRKLPRYLLYLLLVTMVFSAPFVGFILVLTVLGSINPLFWLGAILLLPMIAIIIYYSLRLYPTGVLYATEDLPILQAVKRAYSITKGNLTFLFLIVFGFLLIVLALSLILGVILGILSLIHPLLDTVTAVVQIFWQAYTVIVGAVFAVLTYEELKLRTNKQKAEEEKPPEAKKEMSEIIKDADNLIIGNN